VVKKTLALVLNKIILRIQEILFTFCREESANRIFSMSQQALSAGIFQNSALETF
jgi:hypothetical protein